MCVTCDSCGVGGVARNPVAYNNKFDNTHTKDFVWGCARSYGIMGNEMILMQRLVGINQYSDDI